MSYSNKLGKVLKKLRNQRNLNQRELANFLNIAPSTLAMYETGKRNPDYDTLIKIADFFEVSIDYLLGRTEQSETGELLIAENKRNYKTVENDLIESLPEEAKKIIYEFIEFICNKYNNK